MPTVRILGLDPGLARMGWGVVEMTGTRLVHVAPWRVDERRENGSGPRLMALHEGLAIVIATMRPAAIAVEQAFVHKDPSAALKLGHARAVALLAAAQAGLEIAEYAPNHIKKCVVGVGPCRQGAGAGHGAASAADCGVDQADAADALACAIAHAHLSGTRARIEAALA